MAVTKEQLTALYLAYFGRPPDFDGLNYYLAPAQAGLTLEQLEANFSASPESQRLYATTSTAQLIDDIYMNLFNRHAEPDGLAFWSNAINNHEITAAGAAYSILKGALNQDAVTVANKLAIAALWDQHLDTSAEIIGYSGDSASAVARAFLATVTDTNLDASTAALDAAISNAIAAAGHPFTLAVNAPSVAEGDAGTKVLTYTIQLDHAPSSAVTINYQTTNSGTATANTDFAPAAGTVTFAAGQQVATVSVTINGDTTVEGNETVDLMFSSAVLSNSGVVATGTIINDDNPPQTFNLLHNDPTVVEGDSGTKTLTFTVQLDSAPTSPVTISYQTSDGTAFQNSDYTPAAGTITFAAGQTVATVSVQVAGDTVFEGNETFNLTFTGAQLNSPVTAVGTITNDDPDPASLVYTASVSAPTVAEGNSGTTTLAFVIDLGKPAVGPVTISYQTLTTGTATAGTDFVSTGGSITFAAGQQTAVVNVTVNGDLVLENDETVVLQVTGSQLSNSGVTATGTITNDEPLPLLTTGIDIINVQSIPGTVDLIKGIVDGTNVGQSTFSVGDQITGNGSTILELDVAAPGAGAFTYLSNIDKINVVAGAAGFLNFNAVQWSGLNSINLTAGASGLTLHLTSLEAGVDLTIGDSLGGQISATYQTGEFADIWNSGKGGASFVDGDVNITMKNSQTAGAFFSDSKDMTIGDVTIGGSADNASAFFGASAFVGADMTIGDVTITVGDSATASINLQAATGNISVGAVAEVAGSSGQAIFTASGSGDISVASIGQVAGNSGQAVVSITASGDLTVGGIAQTVGSGTAASAYVYLSNQGNGDVTVGDITQIGGSGASASAYVYEFGNGDIHVGNVTQLAGSYAFLTVSTTGSGDVMVGDISQGVSGSYVSAYVFADEGSITVGDVTQVGGTGGTVEFSAANSGASTGDITVGDISQTGGDSETVLAYVYAHSSAGVGGDITIGNVTQTAGDNAFVSVSAAASGDGSITVGDIDQMAGSSASAIAQFYGSGDVTLGDVSITVGDGQSNSAYLEVISTGDISFGDVAISAGNGDNAFAYIWNQGGTTTGGDIAVTVGDSTGTGNTPSGYIGVWNQNATGDVSVGDLSLSIGVSGTGYITVSNSASTGVDLGNLTVGDIAVNLGDKAGVGSTVNVLIQNTQTAGLATSVTTPVDVGTLTVGDVNVAMGTNAQMSVTISNALYSNTAAQQGGDVGLATIGDITINGDVGAVADVWVNVSNTANGDVAGLDMGALSMSVNDGGSVNFSVDVFAEGDVGNVSIGGVALSVGVSGSIDTASIDITGQNVGDVSIGDLSVNLGERASGDALWISVQATNGGIGNVSVGNMSAHIGESASWSDAFGLSVTASGGNVGNVTVGNLDMTLDHAAYAGSGLYVEVSSTHDDVGNVTIGTANINLGTSAYMSDIYRVYVYGDNIGDVTLGGVNATFATSAYQTSYDQVSITANHDIGNVSFGDWVFHLGSNAYTSAGTEAYRYVNAGGSLGDVSIGNVGMYAVTGAYFSTSWNYTISADDGIGDLTVGGVTLQGTQMADSMTMEIFVSNASGDMGDVNLGNWSVHSLSSTYQAYASISIQNYSGDMGDFTVGNVDVMAGGNTSASAYAEFFAYADNIGDVTFGDLSVSSTGGAYAEIVATISASSGDMGDITVGDVAINVLASSEASITLNLTATGDIGNVSIGDINVNVGASGTTGYYGNFDFNANAGGAMGDITVGDVSLTVMKATSGAFVTLNYTASSLTGDSVTIGDISLVGASNTSAQAAFVVNFNNAVLTSSNDVSVGTITMNGTTSSTLTADLNFGTASVQIDGVHVQGTGVFGADYFLQVTGGDISIGTVAFDVSATNAAYNLTGVLTSVTATGALSIGTVDYSLYVLSGASTSISIDVSGFDVANVIGSAYNDTIIVSATPGTVTGGDGTDSFDFTNASSLDTTSAATLSANMYTITDFQAGPLHGETIATNAFFNDVAHYSEKTATTFANAVTVALATMTDPTLQSDIVAVKVGGDTYVFIDADGDNTNIDQVIKLTGVSTNVLNFADFA